MQYQKFRPQEILSPFVECYFMWESQKALDKEMIIESPPSSYPGIVFNYGEPYFLQNKKYPRLAVPQQFVAGLSTYSFKLFLSGRIGIAGIVLKPAALSTLFGLESFEYTEERMDLFTVLKEPYVQTYTEKIRQAEGTVDKVRLMEDFLLHHYKLTRPETDYIDHAANVIAESNGMLHMHDLLKKSCMSRRTFERRFCILSFGTGMGHISWIKKIPAPKDPESPSPTSPERTQTILHISIPSYCCQNCSNVYSGGQRPAQREINM